MVTEVEMPVLAPIAPTVDQLGVPAATKTSADPSVDSNEGSSPSSAHTTAASFDVDVNEKTTPKGNDKRMEQTVSETKTDAGTEIAVKLGSLEQRPCKLISYHRDADMCIRIRDSTGITLCKVSSALVAAASPALKALVLVNSEKPGISLNGNFVLDLVDSGTYSYGLDIILSLIHFKYYEIPAQPDVDQLHSIAQIVEKYDCAHLLVLLMEKWQVGSVSLSLLVKQPRGEI